MPELTYCFLKNITLKSSAFLRILSQKCKDISLKGKERVDHIYGVQKAIRIGKHLPKKRGSMLPRFCSNVFLFPEIKKSFYFSARTHRT
jgi:hypothetical protein